jgi:cation transport regulator ChaC
MLYFAYGSNMQRAGMAHRCPSARALGTAELWGWRYIINRDGYASLVEAAGARVFGVLWRLAPRDLAALNAYENLDSGLYRRRMLAVRCGDRSVKAMAYIGRAGGKGVARPGYQEQIVMVAAREWRLPSRYLTELARWTTRPRLGGDSHLQGQTA